MASIYVEGEYDMEGQQDWPVEEEYFEPEGYYCDDGTEWFDMTSDEAAGANEVDYEEFWGPSIDEEYESRETPDYAEALHAYTSAYATQREAFVTFRGARRRLQEVRKDRWHKNCQKAASHR